MSKQVTKAPIRRPQTWVQTERETHVQWGRLVLSNPAAAAVMHQLVAVMDRQNAVAISHQTLADLVGCHYTTVKRALRFLEEHRWLQIVQIGPRGTVNAYVINDAVAWSDYRENKRLAIFSARIVADAADQSEAALNPRKLRKVPVIHPPERALPTGDWPPGEQATFEGMEPVVEGAPDDYEPENGQEGGAAKPRLSTFRTDEEAARFVDSGDLTDYGLSGGKAIRFTVRKPEDDGNERG